MSVVIKFTHNESSTEECSKDDAAFICWHSNQLTVHADRQVQIVQVCENRECDRET